MRICDFSAAVFGNVSTPHNHDIQPQPFCAPEVLLRAGWTYSADIWNLGTVVSRVNVIFYCHTYSYYQQLWELLADTTLFNGLCHDSARYSREVHIAQMIRLLGPPPPQLLTKCDPSIRDNLFSPQGTPLYGNDTRSTNLDAFRHFQVPSLDSIRGI